MTIQERFEGKVICLKGISEADLLKLNRVLCTNFKMNDILNYRSRISFKRWNWGFDYEVPTNNYLDLLKGNI